MFRFNNPDALLVCLLVAAAYCLVRALEGGSHTLDDRRRDADRVRLPGEDDAGVPGRAGLRARVPRGRADRPAPAGGTAARGRAAMVVSAGWWVAIVALWPASSRPMIDGSSDNSILNLIVGYNGLGRISAAAAGPGGGGGGGELQRPDRRAAAVQRPDGRSGLVAAAGGAARARGRPGVAAARAPHRPHPRRAHAVGQLARRQRPRVQPQRAASSTPTTRWRSRRRSPRSWRSAPRSRGAGVTCRALRALLAVGVVVTAVWSIVLLDRTPSWEPWLRPVIAVAGGVAAARPARAGAGGAAPAARRRR